MITDFQPTAYTLIRDLAIAMHTNATTLLYTKFNLTDAIWEELQEELDHFYGPERQLGIAPMVQAFDNSTRDRPYIALFPMQEPETWGVECVLWNHGKPSEAILHLKLHHFEAAWMLRYSYLGA